MDAGRVGWGLGGLKTPRILVLGQEEPLTAVLQHFNQPGIQTGQQVLLTKAFKCKASLQLSQLQVKDPGGACSEVKLV